MLETIEEAILEARICLKGRTGLQDSPKARDAVRALCRSLAKAPAKASRTSREHISWWGVLPGESLREFEARSFGDADAVDLDSVDSVDSETSDPQLSLCPDLASFKPGISQIASIAASALQGASEGLGLGALNHDKRVKHAVRMICKDFGRPAGIGKKGTFRANFFKRMPGIFSMQGNEHVSLLRA